MNAAHEAFLQSRDSLFTEKDKSTIETLSRSTVQNYLLNRSIWDELNYYKEHGEILGKHPIFSWMRRVEDIRRMKIGDLVGLKIRLENNLVRNRAILRKEPDSVETARRKERITHMEQELIEVNRLLNI